MLIVLIALQMVIFAGLAVSRWAEKKERARAEEWIASFHGERLPPAETLRGQSATFLLAVMPYYLDEGQKHRQKQAESIDPKLLSPEPLFPRPIGGKPLDPATEPDCPECANGVPHDQCRSGWKDVLREHHASAMDADGYPDAFGDRDPPLDAREIREIRVFGDRRTQQRSSRASVSRGVAAPLPECQVCKDLGFFPEVRGLCPACGKKRNRR